MEKNKAPSVQDESILSHLSVADVVAIKMPTSCEAAAVGSLQFSTSLAGIGTGRCFADR